MGFRSGSRASEDEAELRQFLSNAAVDVLDVTADVVGIYADYRPNEDTIIGFGIDNLFDQYYVRYLDLRTLSTQFGSNNLVPSPSPGITFKGSLKVRFGDNFFKNG